MKTIIIAEISANHGQDIEIALATIKAAKEAGADAVKIQSYTPDTMTIDCNNKYFQIQQGTIWDGTTLYELYKQAYTPWEWHEELFAYAKEIDIEIFSTPFDYTAVDLLESLSVGRYKIASFEITDIPLIEYVASKMKPVIISTGIATIEEIREAVEACRRRGNKDITLLQCTSQYPAKPEDANLLTMDDMKVRFDVKVGLSDHTTGHEGAVAATAMGATIVEKHFILDRGIGGPDATFSMNPDEFKEMVEKVRYTERLMGHVTYDMTDGKRKSRSFARSLFVVKSVKKGEIVSEENVRSIRPGYGLEPRHLTNLIGRKFNKDVDRGTPLSWDIIEMERDIE